MTVELGRVEWLDIRSVWQHEALGFTPWLLENADALAAAVGVRLALEEAEHAVGGFSLDLLGRDLDSGATVIVENQIEQSDHSHLGQLLTYAGGTDASIIIWVARAFREEHRAAIDWLNQHTGREIGFFAVVVRALRIDQSRPAPFFDVVASPNDWQKATGEKAAVVGRDERYEAFWRPLYDELRSTHAALVGARSAPRSYWLTIDSPIRRASLYGELGADDLRVMLDIDTGSLEGNVAMLDRLRAHEPDLRRLLGDVSFERAQVRTRVVQRLTERQVIADPDRHDLARAWFRERLLAAHAAWSSLAPLLDDPGDQASADGREST